MGGRVGLKGTDGPGTLESAILMGARPESPERAIRAMKRLGSLKDKIQVITCPGDMGENPARNCGFAPVVIEFSTPGRTTAAHTIMGAAAMLDQKVDLLLFAGGDGTARDIYQAVKDRLVVLGVPTGVKMHSAVFGYNPERTGDLALLYLQDKAKHLKTAEVMDIDERALRSGQVNANLYGYLTIPFAKGHVQGLKSGSPESEQYRQQAIAAHVIENMEDDVFYIICPGTTTARIMERLGLDYTPLGVDLVRSNKLVAKDLNEAQLLGAIDQQNAKIIVTPIGGHGCLFGRGNQQLSPTVLRTVGRKNIIVVATRQKIISLRGSPLFVDSGDPETNRMISGYFQMITGYKDKTVYRVVY